MGARDSNCLSCFPLSSGVIAQIVKPPVTTKRTEKGKNYFLLLCSVFTNLFLDQLLFFYFLGLEVPASSQREQFSVALTRAVDLCDPGIREVCLAGGREAAYFTHF